MLFVLLSLFDGVAFIHDGAWVLGDAFCRIQSTLIELSYTVSVCTLTVVAGERYISICHPHKIKRTIKQAIRVCVITWIFGIVFCASLLYGYRTKTIGNDGIEECRNDNWSKTSRLSFYIVHSIIVYLIPLAVMCYSHYYISKALYRQKMRTFSTFSNSCDQITSNTDDMDVNKNDPRKDMKESKVSLDIKKELKRNAKQATRRLKVIRILVVITIVFFVLWTPFIVVRLLKYFSVEIHTLLWSCLLYTSPSPRDS